MDRPGLGKYAKTLAIVFGVVGLRAPSPTAAGSFADFQKNVQPVLPQYCYDCHADGANKGNVALDQFKSDQDIAKNRELWWKVLKNVRAGIMPPQKKDRPGESDKLRLANWIKYDAFGIDPKDPDPGRVTIRRLNRVEYRNTIRDLMGVDFNTTEEFPPDDTGYGFDTIGDVLSISPMLLEKYMQAAEKIVGDAVPTVARTMPEKQMPGSRFRSNDLAASGAKLIFTKPVEVSATMKVQHAGEYHLALNLAVRSEFDFDPSTCELILKVDDSEQWRQPLKWGAGRKLRFEIDQRWNAGERKLAFEVHPLNISPRTQSPYAQIVSVDVQGPKYRKFWIPSKNFKRFFTKEQPPRDQAEKRAYARQVLSAFVKKAFRRPSDDRSLDRLVQIAEQVYSQPNKSFEEGIKESMVAVLSSPRFLFRVEQGEASSNQRSVPVDEYSLASRLSYFLWSTMPDDQLFALADRHELRKNLPAQLKRMMDDPRSQSLIENFAGQWLQLRDVEGVNINARVVFAQDNARPTSQPASRPAGFRRFARPPIELDDQLRTAMRREVEMTFTSIVKDDRSLSDLLDCNYTYLNEKLAKLYNIDGVTGTDMRRVELSADSPRGGLLTSGAFLVVTSNPTRTSPVKRGQFILDNVLGMPTPPPPADIPALEESDKQVEGRNPSFREVLEMHRSKPLCRSCHSRMDPLGLSLENFNALGIWRERERGLPIDASGQLITGEKFQNIRQLKAALKRNHITDFYRCVTEKLLTYALGRGLDENDVETVDRIVDRLQRDNGRFLALLYGVVESTPFQKRRNLAPQIGSAR
jgi:hypothetical protein